MPGAYSTRPTTAQRKNARLGSKRYTYEKNKKIILATQSICGICGKPVDKSLKYPHPMSATIDHIIPLAKNGDPSALENLQLAHRFCNRQKSDHMPDDGGRAVAKRDINRILPLTRDWANE